MYNLFDWLNKLNMNTYNLEGVDKDFERATRKLVKEEEKERKLKKKAIKNKEITIEDCIMYDMYE